MNPIDLDHRFMARAIELAWRGQGLVEPNPMVGCVIAQGETVVGEGWHGQFGGPHAEVEALRAAGEAARGATLYVTLEPCCHYGKTPPCTLAILAAQPARIVVAQRDPFPRVDGGGLRQLATAGMTVETGILESAAQRLNAPYLKLIGQGRPWVHAKWAMTLDGKLATTLRDSRWISNEASRRVVHALRGRMDAILVGRGTVEADDPQLTARPPGPRTPLRIVLDSHASFANDRHLVRTARDIPVLVVTGPLAPAPQTDRLQKAGCEIFAAPGQSYSERILSLLDELGRRRLTNVLAEGGGGLLGALHDVDQIDEVHAFVAPKIIGGQSAPTPIAGQGVPQIALAHTLEDPRIELLTDDIYIRGRIRRSSPQGGSQDGS